MQENKSVEAVRLQGLVKEFRHGAGRINALSGLDLAAEQGEFTAVMGASGSGKSTLLHLIAGLTRPTSGTVEVEGVDLSTLSDRALTIFRRRRIGLVFQSFNLIPHLTAEENILIPLLADGYSAKKGSERTRNLIEELEIADQLCQYPDTLSGGQQQRVALARALAMEPAVLLADEPTGNLDSVASQTICRILDKFNREKNRTIILVTHEPAVAIWSRRILILRDGTILADLETQSFKDAQELAACYQDIVRGAESTDAILARKGAV